jgi:hypothetical protein
MSLSRRSFIGVVTLLPQAWSRAITDDSLPPALQFRREPAPIITANQVLNVAGFEALARQALPPAHFGYIATGADDDRTVIRNHEAFAHYAAALGRTSPGLLRKSRPVLLHNPSHDFKIRASGTCR